MVYVTGDTHGHIDTRKLNTKNFPEGKSLTKDDYVIICGDFGMVWDNSNEDKYWQNWLTEKPWTTLFVDGNHENHHLLSQYPIEIWNGGKIHKISNSIFHLMRGQVFKIEGKTFFTMGGATSIDKAYRKLNVSWWEEEVPSYEECEEGYENLEKNDKRVDYIITHTGPEKILEEVFPVNFFDPTSVYLNIIAQEVEFKHWYFGHMHIDRTVQKKFTFMYHNIKRII